MCPAATNIALDTLTPRTAIITFTPTAGSAFAVVVGPFGFDPLVGGGISVPTIGDSAIVTGLNPSTTYQAYVVATCPGGAPSLLGPVSFSTPSGVGLAPDALAAAVQVFPNPTAGAVQVRLHQTGTPTTRLTVLDALGRVVRRATLADNATHALDLRELAPGLYSLRFEVGEQQTHRWLSVQR